MINPATVTGEVDATGCNIGVYYDNGVGVVNDADIYGANYFGVLVNGDVNDVSVDVTNSSVHHIGEVPPNGSQHGVAVYYRALATGTATGNVSGNTIWNYQKGGITVNGAGATVSVTNNTVTGLGPVDFIAQNGIQVGYGATAVVTKNNVSGNSYTGHNWVSGGIIVVGGPYYGYPYTVGTQIVGNTIVGNDVGVYLSNWDISGPPATPTNVKVINNVIDGTEAENPDYQAGISDLGNNDKLIANTITGYVGCGAELNCYSIDSDSSYSPGAKVHANITP